jgi:hypothetical protein
MKTYRRILVPSISVCPSLAQLTRCGEIAAAGDSEVKVVLFIDTASGIESDGPAGVLPEGRAARKVPSARRRLDLLLAGNGLSWARSAVAYGAPGSLLSKVLRQWQPDLVIVPSGWWHARWVERAAQKAEIVTPDILGVKADGLFGKLRAWLPLVTDAMHFPPGHVGSHSLHPANGGYHHGKTT